MDNYDMMEPDLDVSADEWSSPPAPKVRKKKIFNKTNGICAYCGQKLDPFEFHDDHVIPRTRGGPTNLENLVPACRGCNIRKKNSTPEEFKEWILSGGMATIPVIKGFNKLVEFYQWIELMVDPDSRKTMYYALSDVNQSLLEFFDALNKSTITFKMEKIKQPTTQREEPCQNP